MAEVAEADEVAVARPGGVPMKIVLLIGVGALVLGLVGAVAVVKLNESPQAPVQEGGAAVGAPRAGTDGKTKAASITTPGTIFDLDPFIVNLADAPEIRYLKLTMKLELERPEAAMDLAARLPAVRDTLLILLSSKEAAGVRTSQGKLQLREEVTQRVNALLPKGGVRTAYFIEFVVQ